MLCLNLQLEVKGISPEFLCRVIQSLCPALSHTPGNTHTSEHPFAVAVSWDHNHRPAITEIIHELALKSSASIMKAPELTSPGQMKESDSITLSMELEE